MNANSEAPYIPKDVVEWLDRQWPESCADPKDSDREIWMKSGERRLIRRLKLEQQHQEEQNHVSIRWQEKGG